jgi:ABC-2 type transport system permease protein
MSGPSFKALLGWELRRIGRSPLLWMVLAAIIASFVWGATTTAALHRDQMAAQARILAAQDRWLADVHARADRYSRPAPPGTPELPTWQDPTDLSGFARFFLFTHSLKPHLPLSPLATGNSDLAPSWLQVKVNMPFAGEPAYDFENPRGLALGAPGLDFAIVYLLPIGLILLFGLLATFEQDHGMLPLIAAQPVSPRRWLFARLSATVVWTGPVVLAGLVLALAIASVPLGADLPALGTALAVVTAYILFWTSIAAMVLAHWPGSAAAIGGMTTIWAVLTIGLPLAAALLLSTVNPPPSRTAYVDLQRRVSDAVDENADAVVTRGLAQDALFGGTGISASGVKDLARISFILPEVERRLMPARAAFSRYRADQLLIAEGVGYAAPPLGISMALARLAGTDDARQIRFEERTTTFQAHLRGFFFDLARKQVVVPVASDPTRSRGKLNFTGFDNVPRYVVPVERPDAGGVWPFISWLLGVSGLILFVAGRRLKTGRARIE